MNDIISLQLYSIRDIIFKDWKENREVFVDALEKVAAMGYDGVEYAVNYGGLTAKELKVKLDELGLKSMGTHSGMDTLEPEALKETIAFHKELGTPYIICPYAKMETYEELMETIEFLTVAAKTCKESGIGFGYHNHAHEFVKFDGKYALDIMMEKIPADLMMFELDLFWVNYAGVDPQSYVETHKDRIKILHLKESDAEKENVIVGDGIIDFKACCDIMRKEGNYSFIVEQEHYPNDMCPMDAAKACIDNIKGKNCLK